MRDCCHGWSRWSADATFLLLPPTQQTTLTELFGEQRRRIQAIIGALEAKLTELGDFHLSVNAINDGAPS